MRLFPLISAVVVPVAFLANCESDATAPLLVNGRGDQSAVTVIPSVATVGGGKELKLTARVRHADGSISEPADVVWSSTDGTIATVDTKGLVHGLRAGHTRILASWRTSRGSSVITVLEGVSKKADPQPCQLQRNADGSIPLRRLCLS